MTRINKALMLGLLEDYARHRLDDLGNRLHGFDADAEEAKERAVIVKKTFESLLDKELDD